MTDHIDQTIADLQQRLKPIEDSAIKLKTTINQLCDISGKPIIYKLDENNSDSLAYDSIKSDEFYGKPLAQSVRKILEIRKESGLDAPCSVREILDTLKAGGFRFETKNDANSMRGLRVSLTKNVSVFHKLPNGKFGLLSWYPKVKPSKQTNGDGDGDAATVDQQEQSSDKNQSDGQEED